MLLVVSRHLGRCITEQVIVDQTRRWRSAGRRRVRLRRLTNPKVEVLVWASLLRCWPRSLALQKTEQELTVSVGSLRSLGSLSCEKVLNADVGSSCTARRWSARGRSTGCRVVGTMLRRRVRVTTAVGRLNGFGRDDVARWERQRRWLLWCLLGRGETKETSSIISHTAVDGRHVAAGLGARRLETRLWRVYGAFGD